MIFLINMTTPIFDLFKVGPGLSSSHTIGAMKVVFDFQPRVGHLPELEQQRANGLHVYLYGSLSAMEC